MVYTSEMLNYQFVDTNVLVYAHDPSAGIKHEKAKALMQNLWETKTGCLSIQVLQELFVTMTRKVPVPIPVHEAAQIVAELGTWRVHQPYVEDILSAVQFQERYRISFWDAMIIQSAAQLKCKILFSEDLNDGQAYATVRVINPFGN